MPEAPKVEEPHRRVLAHLPEPVLPCCPPGTVSLSLTRFPKWLLEENCLSLESQEKRLFTAHHKKIITTLSNMQIFRLMNKGLKEHIQNM